MMMLLPRSVAALLVASLIPLAGCGLPPPKAKISALAESARAVADAAATTYPKVQALQVDARAAELMTSERVQPSDYELHVDRTCTPVEDPQRKAALDRAAAEALRGGRDGAPLPPAPAIGPRLQCIQDQFAVVVSYLELLDTFASADYGGDVDKASEKLSASIAGVDKSNQRLTQAAGVLATVVDVIGRQVVEHKRRAALIQAMQTAQAPLETIAALMIRDNTYVQTAAVDQYRDSIAVNWMQVRRAPRYPLDARRELDRQIAQSTAEASTIDAGLQSMNAAIEALPHAHAEVRDEMVNGKPGAMQQLRLLVAEGRRIERFHKSLTKSE